jgi:hypothetical protein
MEPRCCSVGRGFFHFKGRGEGFQGRPDRDGQQDEGVLPPQVTIQSAQQVGDCARQRFPEKIGIQHPKLVTDGADGSTATIPRGSVFRFWLP